jgi:hypothetical protein
MHRRSLPSGGRQRRSLPLLKELRFTLPHFFGDRPGVAALSVQVLDDVLRSRDFAGARDVSAENSLMTKRALFAVAGFLGLCLSLSAQPTQSLEQFPFTGSTLDRPFLPLPALTLADQERFSFLAFSWQTPVDFLPSFNPTEPERVARPTLPGRGDPHDNVGEMRAPDRVYVGGEVGFLYGRSSGKYGREFESGYVIGEIGNDYFHLTVGTSYEKSSGRVPRWGR